MAYEGYQLQVDGQPVAVYACRVSAEPLNQWWPGYQRPIEQTELAGSAYWDMQGSVTVKVTTKRAIDSVVIRPLSLAIEPKVEGNKISFALDRIIPVVVEVNGYHNCLHLFPNPAQDDAPKVQSPIYCSQCNYCSPTLDSLPKPDTSRLYCCGPGVHDVGTLVLRSNDSVNIAGGAIVYGSLIVDDADSIRVWGRGVLDGSRIRRAARRARGGFGCLHFRNSTNISVEGIVLSDPTSWGITLRGCREVKRSNLKLVGFWRYNADGIDVWNCEDVSFGHCFIRAFDDVFVVRGSGRNIRCSDCVLWCDWGHGLALAGGPIEQVAFKNIDMIRLAHVATRIRDRNSAVIRDIAFDAVNVESPRSFLFGFPLESVLLWGFALVNASMIGTSGCVERRESRERARLGAVERNENDSP